MWGTHIKLTANVCDVVSINIGHILHIEEEKHCITKDDKVIDATVIAAVTMSFEEDPDCLRKLITAQSHAVSHCAL